jgi:hypothetical protein
LSCFQKFHLGRWTEYMEFVAKLDADSVYYGSPTCNRLVGMCGTECQFSINSLLQHNYASSGSRWSMDCRALTNHPITLRGYEAGCVNYNRLPNTHVMDCHLKSMPGNIMSIYITLTGVERIRKTNFFYLEEVALVNAALNLASMEIKTTESESDIFNDTSMRIQYFETKVRGKFSKHITNRRENVGVQSMRNFSDYFDKALAYILADTEWERFMNPDYSGMKFDKGDGLCKKKFKAAIETFKRGIYYSANLAGVKESFKETNTFIRHFNDGKEENKYTQTKWTEFIKKSSDHAYDFLKDEVFKGALKTPRDVYHFDIGLEITPVFKSNHSFLVDMVHAERRLKQICNERRTFNVYDEHEAVQGLEVDEDSVDQEGQEEIRSSLLDTTNQQLFETGEFHSPDEIHDIPNYIASLGSNQASSNSDDVPELDFEPEADITTDDMFYEDRMLGINTFEKYLSNGNVGGVHSGSAPLRLKDHTNEPMEFGVVEPVHVEREVIPCRNKMKVCGGQIYGPGVMSDNLTKQRKNLDDFASLPNLMARILSTNPGTVDSKKSDLYDTFTDLVDNLSMYIDDCKSRLEKSSQHSVRFEIFFMSRFKTEYNDFEFPDIDLKEMLYVVKHDEFKESLSDDLVDNLKPLQWISTELTIIKNSKDKSIPTPERLIASVKTRLVCCCELIVSMIDVRGFQGRIMTKLYGLADDQGNIPTFFEIPEQFKRTLDVVNANIDGISFGLDPTLLLLPKVSSHRM